MLKVSILHHVAPIDKSVATLTTSVKAALVASLCHAMADSIAVETAVNAVRDVPTAPNAHGRAVLEKVPAEGIIDASPE